MAYVFCPYLGKGRGRGQRSKGNFVFPVSILFTNPKGLKEHVQAQSARRGDFEKNGRNIPREELSCSWAKEVKEMLSSVPLLLPQPLKNLWQQRGRVSEQESVFKAHLLEYKTQREAKQSPFIFQAIHLPPLTGLIKNMVACAWAGDERQAVLPEFPGGHSSCPTELYFRGKVELPL